MLFEATLHIVVVIRQKIPDRAARLFHLNLGLHEEATENFDLINSISTFADDLFIRLSGHLKA